MTMAPLSTRPCNRLRMILDRGLTVANLVDKAAAAHDDTPLFLLDAPVPYADLGDRVEPKRLQRFADRMAHLLTSRCGMRRYDRVAIIKANGGDIVLLGMAIIRAGGITVPINGGMSPEIVASYLAYTGARILITDHATYRRLRLNGGLPRDLCHILFTDAEPRHGAADDVRVTGLAAALDEIEPRPFAPVKLGADDDVLICHTSGTTGVPKGVLHTNGTLVAGIRGQLMIQPVFRGDVAVSASPFNHFINHLGLMAALAGQLRVWLLANPEPKAVLDLIDREKVSVVFCFPHTYLALYAHGLDRHDLSSVRIWMAAADSSHEQHILPFVRRGAFLRLFGRRVLGSVFMDTLGTSEVGFAALINPIADFAGRFGRCVGWPSFAGPRVKVADELGRELPTGEVGRLMVKGPTLFKGYWNAHDMLHGVKHDGWWWTGDLAWRDRAGRFYHIDRAVDVIETAAGPVYSLPIEELLLKHPGVAEAVVVAADGEGGKAPLALVQPMPGQSLDPQAVRRWANEHLPPHSALFDVHVVESDTIPRGLTGKVLKRVLRERLAAPQPAQVDQPATPLLAV